jgi:hypothetical protein
MAAVAATFSRLLHDLGSNEGGGVMASRARFLKQVWTDIIDAPMNGLWIDSTIAAADSPNTPFADAGGALRRLLAQGADRKDLCIVARLASYEAAFALLYMLDDPGVDEDNNKVMHEELLVADPSGREGRPAGAR